MTFGAATHHTAVGWSLSHPVASCQRSRAESPALPLLFVPRRRPSGQGHVTGAAAAAAHLPLGSTPPASGYGGLVLGLALARQGARDAGPALPERLWAVTASPRTCWALFFLSWQLSQAWQSPGNAGTEAFTAVA